MECTKRKAFSKRFKWKPLPRKIPIVFLCSMMCSSRRMCREKRKNRMNKKKCACTFDGYTDTRTHMKHIDLKLYNTYAHTWNRSLSCAYASGKMLNVHR